MNFWLGDMDSLLGGVISVNLLLLIVVVYEFIRVRMKIYPLRKKITETGHAVFADLNIKNQRFLFLALLGLVIGSFEMIFSWFNNFASLMKAAAPLAVNDFFLRMFLVALMSVFNSALSALLFVVNKMSISKLEKDHY